MSNYAIIGIAKLKGAAIGSSDSHADRTRETPNADEKLLGENKYLRGGKTPLRELLDENFAEFGGKQRKDAVECLEFMCSASPEFFAADESAKEERTKQFIEQIEEFIAVLDDKEIKIIKAVIHLDETTPHASLFGVPRDEKGALNAKYHIGTRAKMAGFHDVYAEAMQPLGLKRGIRGSRATHQDVKKFYATIISEPELNISSKQIPNPPAGTVNEDQQTVYKEQVIASVRAAILPQVAQMRNQAMLTNHYKGFREAAEERAAKLAAELQNKNSELENKDSELAATQARLKILEDRNNEYAATKKQLVDLQTAQTDLPFIKVSRLLTGQSGDVSSTGETYFADAEGQFVFYIDEKNDTAAYGIGGEKYAATAIELAQKIHRQNGKMGSVAEAVGGLAEHFNDEEITAALGSYSFHRTQASWRESAVPTFQTENSENLMNPIIADDSSQNEVKIAAAEMSATTDDSLVVSDKRLIEDEDELNGILDRIQPTEQQKNASLPVQETTAANKVQRQIDEDIEGFVHINHADGEVKEIEYEVKAELEVKSVIAVAPQMTAETANEVEKSVGGNAATVQSYSIGTTIEPEAAESIKVAEPILSAEDRIQNVIGETADPSRSQTVTELPKTGDVRQNIETVESVKAIEKAEKPRRIAADPPTTQKVFADESAENLSSLPSENEGKNREQSDSPVKAKNTQTDDRVSAAPTTSETIENSVVSEDSLPLKDNRNAPLKTRTNLSELIGKTSSMESLSLEIVEVTEEARFSNVTDAATNATSKIEIATSALPSESKPMIAKPLEISSDSSATEATKTVAPIVETAAAKVEKPDPITVGEITPQTNSAEQANIKDDGRQIVKFASVGSINEPSGISAAESEELSQSVEIVAPKFSKGAVNEAFSVIDERATTIFSPEKAEKVESEIVDKNDNNLESTGIYLKGRASDKSFVSSGSARTEASPELSKTAVEIPVFAENTAEKLTDTKIEFAKEIGIESNGAISAATETSENKQLSEVGASPKSNEEDRSPAELPATQGTDSEPAMNVSTSVTEAEISPARTNSDDIYADSADDWFYQEQEKIFAENRAAQDRQFQNALEQNIAQSETLQPDFEATIESLTKQFEQIQQFGQRSYEDLNASEDDVFENLRRTTDFNNFEQSQPPPPPITDDEVQERLEHAAAKGLSDKTEAELQVRHQLQQTEDVKQQAAQEQETEEEQESEEMDFDDDSIFSRGRSM